ncbi:MAG: hypothetical protein QOI57_1450 [Rubrobacteraceae bacterium]|nr:hypothetical protein [Rubrobacteraceae bacterium]
MIGTPNSDSPTETLLGARHSRRIVEFRETIKSWLLSPTRLSELLIIAYPNKNMRQWGGYRHHFMAILSTARLLITG